MKKLNFTELKATCDPSIFDFKTTEELKPFEEGIIGQRRAVKAMNFGLKIKQKGYHIFMAGITGTGKTTYAKTLIKNEARKYPVPDDWCYIYNFDNPEIPKALNLPAGIGIKLKEDMEKLIDELRTDIPKTFESEEYEKQRNQIMDKYQEQSNMLIMEFEEELKKEGFLLQRTGKGIFTIPLKDGRPLSQEDFEQMTEEEKNNFKEKSKQIQIQMEEIMRKIRRLEVQAREEIEQLEERVCLSIVKPIIDHLKDDYQNYPRILKYLNDVQEDIIKNLEKFKAEEEIENPLLLTVKTRQDESFFTRYKVNLLVNNKETKGAPVVIETNPTYYNLFGKIEGESEFGTVVTDFTMIKGGAVHRANGGYLILQAKDVLSNPFAWEALKRTLANQEIRVENIGEQFRTIPTTTLKPEPIPLNIKVILIGNPLIYQLLYDFDEDFKKLFKIKAHFDVEMDKTEENLKKFACFISFQCEKEGLRHFTAEAVARVVEYSSRLAENQKKLTTRFNEIVEILYEASAWAEIDNSKYVEESHVEEAIKEKIYRSNLMEEKIQEMIENGHILIDTEGEEVGQINGLSVYQTGEYSFGRPSRITARTFLGEKGVINIEREAKMSGKIHDKAVLILSGYLGGKYAKDKPLTLSASLAFEQSYGGIEGDSASCAELIALLSAISGIPVRQDFAITGSMNQKGKVQPIGGVNQKIEGFYKVCKAKGLTGTQGVVIPVQNIENLMLDKEIIEAVKDGKFHIYSVKDIDEAIEIMMKKPAEEVHKEVNKKLKELAKKAEKFTSRAGQTETE
ncbi:ATP-dependent protease [Anoxybacter fermentans]|uniref:endopeptidase La n=1 Tax=Anoxybacter fermentans TaxID=1323375 RepID=A0A3Q9HPG1_9FIRM|nr:ATP-binding protein [Anoxybacter fermentans]AZR72610.1 ATP-dependent protease [Anoxybacter fermentans]